MIKVFNCIEPFLYIMAFPKSCPVYFVGDFIYPSTLDGPS